MLPRLILTMLLGAAVALPASAQVGAGLGLTATSGDAVLGLPEAGVGTRATATMELGTAATGTEVRTAAQVGTDADLALYAETLKVSDEQVANVEADDDRIEVTYAHDGRLFGFIPVRVFSKTTGERGEGGEVTAHTRMPWWNAFVSGTERIEAEVDALLARSQEMDAAVALDADAAAKARGIEAIASAHARVAASLAASGE